MNNIQEDKILITAYNTLSEDCGSLFFLPQVMIIKPLLLRSEGNSRSEKVVISRPLKVAYDNVLRLKTLIDKRSTRESVRLHSTSKRHKFSLGQ